MAQSPNPYEDLEPAPLEARTSRRREAGTLRTILRGLRRRCPRCGGGNLFEGPFRVRRACPRCGLRLEREEGGFLGAMTINYTVTTLLWLVLLVLWLVLDLPDVHVLGLTVASLLLVGVFPLAFWSFSKTIWAAVDLLVYRSDPGYGSASAADRARGNGGPG
jgi:uncharacterized protein (DUF983 family)